MKKIKVLKQMDVTDLAGEKVMIDFETGKYLLLKGVANDIWDMIADDVTVESIIEKLLSEYEVTEEVCTSEVNGFMDKLVGYEMIKLENC